jgi:hypothetical protein
MSRTRLKTCLHVAAQLLGGSSQDAVCAASATQRPAVFASFWLALGPEDARIPLIGGVRIGLVARGKEPPPQRAWRAADERLVALGIVRSGSVLITKAIAGDGPVSVRSREDAAWPGKQPGLPCVQPLAGIYTSPAASFVGGAQHPRPRVTCGCSFSSRQCRWPPGRDRSYVPEWADFTGGCQGLPEGGWRGSVEVSSAFQ